MDETKTLEQLREEFRANMRSINALEQKMCELESENEDLRLEISRRAEDEQRDS